METYAHHNGEHVWFSKNLGYERPYIVTGNIKHAGLQQKSKGIYVKIGLLERGKLHGDEVWRRNNNKRLNV